jgi:hypothetical protein
MEGKLFAILKDKNPNLDCRIKAPVIRMTHYIIYNLFDLAGRINLPKTQM